MISMETIVTLFVTHYLIFCIGLIIGIFTGKRVYKSSPITEQEQGGRR